MAKNAPTSSSSVAMEDVESVLDKISKVRHFFN